MRFPSILAIDDYVNLLAEAGFVVEIAQDTGQFASHFALYREIVTMQLTYDALKAVDYDTDRMATLERERQFIARLAQEGKIIQAMFVGRRE
jgi:hypothetical protein